MADYNIVKDDFNEIAELGKEPKWNHNNCYFPCLLRHIPVGTKTCLDIGCGKGDLSVLLSKRAKKVIAVDFADKMIKYAKANNSSDNIEYICGDILDMNYNPASFDIIISTATAHHLSYDWLLEFAKDKLRPNGKLIILDLAKYGSIMDYIVWGSAVIPNIIMNLIKNGKLSKDNADAANIWKKHIKHDTYMTIDEIRTVAAQHISDAKIQRKLFWRYSLVWEKK